MFISTFTSKIVRQFNQIVAIYVNIQSTQFSNYCIHKPKNTTLPKHDTPCSLKNVIVKKVILNKTSGAVEITWYTNYLFAGRIRIGNKTLAS